jgi:hypothetical protein
LNADRRLVRQVASVPVIDGFILLSPAAGAVEARIAADGFERADVSLSVPHPSATLAALSQLVIEWPFSKRSNLPVSLEVYVLPITGEPGSMYLASRVHGADAFTLLVRPATISLLVYSPGNGVAEAAPLVCSPGSQVRVESFGLSRGRDTTISLTASADDQPVSSASLRLQCESSNDASNLIASWLSAKRWKSNDKGKIELWNLPPASCVATVSAKDLRTLTIPSILESESQTPKLRNLVLRPLPRLSVELDRSILARADSAEVTLIASELDMDPSATDGDAAPVLPKNVWSGHVKDRTVIRGLEPGLYRALARFDGQGSGVEFRFSASADAPDEQTVRIHFDPRLLRGRVLLGEEPAVGVGVDVLPHDRRVSLDAQPLAWTTTDASGYFEVPVSYLGSIILRAKIGEKNLVYRMVEPDVDLEKEIVLRGWGTEITLRVSDAATTLPIQEAEVEITHLLGDGQRMASARPVLGETTLIGLGPGKLKLRVSAPGYRSDQRDLNLLGDEQLQLDFVLGAKNVFKVAVVDERGEPVEGCEVLSVDSMAIPTPGSTSLRSLGRTDWTGETLLEDPPLDGFLAFVRPGYSLQFSRATPLSEARSDEPSTLAVSLSSLREKLQPEEAQRLGQWLSGPPTFITMGFLIPAGLGRFLATKSGLNDDALLASDSEGLLLWSRLLPPGRYSVATLDQRTGSATSSPAPRVITITLE